MKHPFADLLRDVRNGAWSYDELIDWAELQDKEIAKLCEAKPLRHSPDRDKIDELVTDLVMRFKA